MPKYSVWLVCHESFNEYLVNADSEEDAEELVESHVLGKDKKEGANRQVTFMG